MSEPIREGRQLVLVSGPVASGKTTVALELARIARGRGQRAAAIDMDSLVEMVAGNDWTLVQSDHWRLARELAAAIADRLFENAVEVVLLAGPFFNPKEREHLLQRLASLASTCFVMLRVSLPQSLRRAQADSSRRVLTRDADFLAKIYATIDWAALPRQDVDLDTDGRERDDVVAIVAKSVFSG